MCILSWVTHPQTKHAICLPENEIQNFFIGDLCKSGPRIRQKRGGLSLQSQIRFWPVSNMSSTEWLFHGHVYLKWHRCELQTEEWILPVGNILCYIPCECCIWPPHALSLLSTEEAGPGRLRFDYADLAVTGGWCVERLLSTPAGSSPRRTASRGQTQPCTSKHTLNFLSHGRVCVCASQPSYFRKLIWCSASWRGSYNEK